MFKMFTVIMMFTISSAMAIDTWGDEDEKYLKKFQQNPREQMNVYPHKKYDSNIFSPEEISNRSFIEKKIETRINIINPTSKKDSPWRRNDKAENLIDQPQNMLSNLQDMENRSLLKGVIRDQPWSDDYWPIADGMLAKRYLDPEWPYGTWKELNEYVSLKPYTEYLNSNSIMMLSPAEKYDLLVGDKKMSLTKAMWKDGERYWAEYGDVERWMGLCHGWAVASYMAPTPQKMIIVKDVTGKHDIPFTVSDIKSLSTLLWSKGEYENKFIGGRCHSKEPTQDENGRIIEEDCLDTNPGTWHLVVTNQIGINKRSFILDATYDYQVWNQPAISYEYRYFEPQTKKSLLKLQDALIPVQKFHDDIFKNHRSPRAKFIVGVSMDFTYAVENSPSDQDHQPTMTRKVKYLYDLELDENLNIVGGEWYNNHHPDFLWGPPAEAELLTAGDHFLGTAQVSNFNELKNDRWAKAIQANSSMGLPVGKIVQRLIELAQ